LISNFLFFAKRGSEERVFSTSEGEVEDVVRWVMENDEEWGRIHFDFVHGPGWWESRWDLPNPGRTADPV
jgi:hypothetical protein